MTSACDYLGGSQLKFTTAGPGIDVKLRLDFVTGPTSCTTGSYLLGLLLRITMGDAACATGRLTMIDAPLAVSIEGDNYIREKFLLETWLENTLGVTIGHAADYEVLSATMTAPDSLPMASAGVGGGSLGSWESNVSVPYPACTMVTIRYADRDDPADDKLSLRGTFTPVAIDPNVNGATFALTDRNRAIYSVTIPAGA